MLLLNRYQLFERWPIHHLLRVLQEQLLMISFLDAPIYIRSVCGTNMSEVVLKNRRVEAAPADLVVSMHIRGSGRSASLGHASKFDREEASRIHHHHHWICIVMRLRVTRVIESLETWIQR